MTTDSRRVRIIKNLTKRRRRDEFPLHYKAISREELEDFNQWRERWAWRQS